MIVSLLGSCALVVVGCLMSAAAPIDGTFSYQGRLTNSGAPVTGMADLTFSLWDAGAAGAQIGADIVLLNVPVSDGLFNVELDFGVAALDGEQRWLEIEARSPAGVGGYTLLTPRQPLLGAPYAIQTRGLFVDAALNVGIGTTSPASLLHVRNDATGQGLRYNPGGGGVTDLSLYSHAGELVLHNIPFDGPASSASQMTFLDGSGNLSVNIGSAFPEGDGYLNIWGEDSAFNFQVRGNPDATTDGVSNTRMFIRSSGVGGIGGEFSVRNNDGDETIELLGGGSAAAGTLSMFDQTTGNATVTLEGEAFTTSGGRIATWSEDGFQQFEVEPDSSGSGAFVTMKRSNTSNGFTFDGNDGGTGDAQLTISGASRSVNIQTRFAGSASVSLPTDAIQDTEILDEPGVASATSNAGLLLTGAVDTIISRTITVPASGYCVVIGTFQANVTHTVGTFSFANFGVSDVSTSFPLNQDIAFTVPSVAPSSSSYRVPGTVHGTFSVSAGANTFYLLGDENGGSWSVNDPQLTVMYFPTAYGTVMPTLLARDGAGDDDSAPQTLPMSADDIYAEQLEAALFNQARLQSELAEYAQRFREMEAQLLEVQRLQGLGDRAPRRAGPLLDDTQSGVVLGHNNAGSR